MIDSRRLTGDCGHGISGILTNFYPVKFLPRSTSLFLLFNWGMSMTACHVEFMTMTAKKIQQRRSVFHWGDERFGDDWPARSCLAMAGGSLSPKEGNQPRSRLSLRQGGPGKIPAQLVAHALFYFTKPGDLVLCTLSSDLRFLTSDLCLLPPVLRTPERKPPACAVHADRGAENAGQTYFRNRRKNLADRKKIIIAVPAKFNS